MIELELVVAETDLNKELKAFLERTCPRSELLPDAWRRADPQSGWMVVRGSNRLEGACSFILLEEMGRIDLICTSQTPSRAALLDSALKRTRTAGKRRLVVAGVDSRWLDMRRFLEQRGLRPVNDYIKMEYTGAPLPRVQLPPGYKSRTYRPGDEAGWARCINRAYETERDKANWTAQKVMKSFVGSPSFMPDGCFFVTKDEEIVGACMAWREPSEGPRRGRLHWLGVDPDHRGKGIGKFLAVRVVEYLLSHGLDSIYLVTSYTYTKAIPLYKSIGFVETPRILDYYFDLDSPTSSR